MATIRQLPSGSWRVQVRRNGLYAAKTFERHRDAQAWGVEAEHRINKGERPNRSEPQFATVGQLIDLHERDMCAVGRSGGRSKFATLMALKKRLGALKLTNMTRERLISFGRERAQAGAGPVTLAMDFTYLKIVVTHAAAIHGLCQSSEPIDLARIALKRLGLIGKSRPRDRRPESDELERLLAHFEAQSTPLIPMSRIVRFAVASGLRQEEITRIQWSDLDEERRTVIVRDRKDPRDKAGNHQKVPLLAATGFDAWELTQEQRGLRFRSLCIFPYNPRSIGASFRRACRTLSIVDLHFHDLRHEAASRLFEAGFSIEQVALVTGHKDWKMLKRYTHLRPENLHRVAAGLVRPTSAPPQSPAPAPAASPGEPDRRGVVVAMKYSAQAR